MRIPRFIFSKQMTASMVSSVSMVRNLDKEQAVFAKYDIRNASGLVIGSGSGADIVLNEKYVSARHALMFRRGDRWFIQDTSSNGTFLNSERLLGESALNLYDTIYIVGYKIVFLGDILAINRAGSAFAKLRPVDPAEFAGTGTYEDNSLFSRSPRMIEPLDTDVIELETPPSPVRQNKTPLIFLLGPSLTMEPNKLYLPASKAFLKYRTGIHIGGRVSEQRILELSLPLAKQNERLPDNVGYASDHGMARQIYLPDKLGEEDGWI